MIRRYFIDRKAHRAVERECRLVGFEDCEHDFFHSPRRADVGKLLRKQFPKTAMPGALGNLKFVTYTRYDAKSLSMQSLKAYQ